MSSVRIARSPDLARLRDEGHDISIVAAHLVVRDVPYVDESGAVRRGILISTLNLAGDVTVVPETHVVSWVGAVPCSKDGAPLRALVGGSPVSKLSDELAPTLSFSNKPEGGYANYYDKMKRYIEMLGDQARAIEPNATARTYPPNAADEGSVLHYADAASSRAGIAAVASKLKGQRVAIVGVGGTGSYVLDLVAKTVVDEIHMFDGDQFLTHNAFRAPGAASLEELRKCPMKVDYLASIYSRMHRRIVPHAEMLDETDVDELRAMTFVFLCLTSGRSKQLIVAKLEEWGTPFIDVGMGIQLVDDVLTGVLRVTTSTKEFRGGKAHIAFGDGEADNDYDRNIQIAELNALSAALAVIKWKKLLGVYVDQAREHNSLYVIGGGTIISGEQHAA